jgi:DNA-binding transcriptional regulator YiaG
MTRGDLVSPMLLCDIGAVSVLTQTAMSDRNPAQVERELIGRNLVRARLTRKLTQGEIADELGVDQSVVSMWERGRRRPSATYLTAVATFLDRDYGWFFTDHPDGPKRHRQRRQT